MDANSLEKSQAPLENIPLCIVCFDGPPDIVFLPCKHFVIDKKCLDTMHDKEKERDKDKRKERKDTCVVCRKEIERLIFISE